jgi:hypothetical protein
MCTEMHVGFHVTYPLLLSSFNQNWNVLTDFTKTFQYKISLKLLHGSHVVAHRQTSMMKLIGTLQLLTAYAPKML